MYHFVYQTTRVDGFYYIGVHSTNDLGDGYLGSGKRLLNSVRKHGKQAHSVVVIAMFGTREKALAHEAALVDRNRLLDPLCMNLVLGGASLSEEGIKRLKSKIVSDETRNKMSVAATGRELSDSTKQKLSVALSGKPKGPMSDDTKRKLSESRRAMFQMREALGIKTKLSSKHCESLRKANTGKSLSKETKRKISIAKSKPTGERWMCHQTNKPCRASPDKISELLSSGWAFGRVWRAQ